MKFSHMLNVSILLITIGVHTSYAKPPKGFEKIDQEIVISTKEAQMKYDVKSFSAKPNAKVKMVFKNPDSLPHNLIICTPGKKKGGDKGQEVIDAVLKLGDKGVKMNWEPKGHPRILASSGMVQPGKETTFYFKTPKAEGNYPYICTFPGHYQLMNGMMGVSKKANPITNLTYKIYHGKWDKMPDFSKLKPKKSGVLSKGLFDISSSEIDNGFAFLFSGEIECLKDGKYNFSISSDDGSQLLINKELVVNNDGIHSNKAKSGAVLLKKGKHSIEVKYFEAGGQDALSVSWSGPGFKNQVLSRSLPKAGRVYEGMLIEPPQGEAIIYRNFIDGAGPRAIGVGYHEGVNLAFDANNMRLAMIWRDDFIDGARHWISRGLGFQPPAGDAVIRFPEGVAIAALETAESAWPEAEYRTTDFRFRGYTLDQMQKPTFKYERGNVSIEDRFIPSAGKIKRVINFKAKDTPSNLYFRIVEGIFKKKNESFEGEQLVLAIKGGEALVQDKEIRVPIVFDKGKAQIEVTYTWVK